MFCENCGSLIQEGEAFCSNCGAKVSSQAAQPTPAPAPAPAPAQVQAIPVQPVHNVYQPPYQNPYQQTPGQPVYAQPIYQQPIYQQPAYQNAEFTSISRPRSNPIAIVGMIFGIISIFFSWTMIFNGIPGLVAIICSIVGLTRKNSSAKGCAIAGLITGILGILLGIAYFAFYMYVGEQYG